MKILKEDPAFIGRCGLLRWTIEGQFVGMTFEKVVDDGSGPAAMYSMTMARGRAT